MGAWGQELGDGSNFFLMIYFQNMFLCYDSKPLNFSHWHGNVGQRNNFLFFSLFSDYIFLLGLEHGFVGMGAWG